MNFKNSHKLFQISIVFACVLLAPKIIAQETLRSSQKPQINMEVGAGIPLAFNSTSTVTTTNDLKFGFSLAAQANFTVNHYPVSAMAVVSKTQLLWFREDHAANSDLCSGNFFLDLFGIPGQCSQYQARLQSLVWFSEFGLGLSFAYNHFTNISYKGSEIYNTKWAYGALGLVGGFRQQFGRFSLMLLANLDYGIFSITLTPQKIQPLQVGITIYGMYALF